MNREEMTARLYAELLGADTTGAKPIDEVLRGVRENVTAAADTALEMTDTFYDAWENERGRVDINLLTSQEVFMALVLRRQREIRAGQQGERRAYYFHLARGAVGASAALIGAQDDHGWGER